MCEETGVVGLDELPGEEVYLGLDGEFVSLVRCRICEMGNVADFARRARVGERILLHWLRGESPLRLDVFRGVVGALKLEEADVKILGLRGKNGRGIRWPKLPFDFRTESGVRVIAAVLGDGGIRAEGVYYGNSNEGQIDGFLADVRSVFGDVGLSVWEKSENRAVTIVELPPLCSKILSCVGVKVGRKVDQNPPIPRFIFSLSEDRVAGFISQIIDDEGSVNMASNHITITQAGLSSRESNIVKGVMELLLKLGIESAVYKDQEYSSSRGEDRRVWRIQVDSFMQLERLLSILRLRNSNKFVKLQRVVMSKKLTQYPKKRTREIYLTKMREIQTRAGYFTSSELVVEVKRGIGHVRNMIRKYRMLGLISRIQGVTSNGSTSYPAKYRVSESALKAIPSVTSVYATRHQRVGHVSQLR